MKLSVVMAVPRGMAEPVQAREAFERELERAEGDELLVERGEDASVLVPRLWARGIERSRGEIVALTLSSMIPEEGWRGAIFDAMADGVAGVGGAIEPAGEMRALDWAIHLCRYSGYLLPFEERDAEDVAGDNAAYRRGAIDVVRDAWADGFWETEVDARLLGNGWRLRLTPRMVARQGASVSFLSFCKNRLLHGFRSGRERAGRFTPAGRLARAVLWPATAAVMLSRVGRHAASRGRSEGFRRAFPHLPVFLLLWTAGEAAGYLRGR
ncbi:MAG TPA: hypothetical protein VER78_06830 [Thermoanaerobaculia bacterium]|nr:hypothetical protein [Thermoanaerobaculia bacterium]